MKRTMYALRTAVAVALAMLLVQPQTCLAQAGAWERVKLIEPGKKVHVRLNSGKTVKGTMDAWSEDTLSVRKGKDQVVPVAKSDVARVAMVLGMSRGTKAAMGAGIGGAVGAGLFAGLCAGVGDCEAPAAIAAGSVIVVGGIAAGIAALFPQHKEVIYQAAPASTNPAK